VGARECSVTEHMQIAREFKTRHTCTIKIKTKREVININRTQSHLRTSFPLIITINGKHYTCRTKE